MFLNLVTLNEGCVFMCLEYYKNSKYTCTKITDQVSTIITFTQTFHILKITHLKIYTLFGDIK